MAEQNRESFIFYRSFFEALITMSPDVQGKCLMALADYALNGKEHEMTPEVRLFFTLAKPQIDANNKKYENGCKGAEFGKLGGRPRKNPKETPTKPQQNPKETPNDNDNVNVNVYKKETNKEKSTIVHNLSTKNIIKFVNNQILVSDQLSLLDTDDPDIPLYRKEYGDKVVVDVQNWLIENKAGQRIDKSFIVRQFANFAKRQKGRA